MNKREAKALAITIVVTGIILDRLRRANQTADAFLVAGASFNQVVKALTAWPYSLPRPSQSIVGSVVCSSAIVAPSYGDIFKHWIARGLGFPPKRGSVP